MKHLGKSVAISWIALAGAAFAQGPDIGQELYGQYCATCHGEDGAGVGPLTELMLDKPTDLTTLSQNNPQAEGEFPMLRVLHIIDGRTGLRGHGGPMPTYGDIFTADAVSSRENYGAVLETRGRILSLALYLETLQK